MLLDSKESVELAVLGFWTENWVTGIDSVEIWTFSENWVVVSASVVPWNGFSDEGNVIGLTAAVTVCRGGPDDGADVNDEDVDGQVVGSSGP